MEDLSYHINSECTTGAKAWRERLRRSHRAGSFCYYPTRASDATPQENISMKWSDYLRSLNKTELRLAWVVALVADALQIAVFPLFAGGALSPADTVLDVIVAGILIRLLGWHWAFLPSFAAELLPGFDLFPTWTAAVFYLTHERLANGESRTKEPEVLPPGPAPARRY